MDQDQERYYEDEDQEQEEKAPEESQSRQVNGVEDGNDTQYFIELLKLLKSSVASAKTVPLTGKKIIDGDKLLMIISDMEKNLPDAIQYGMHMYSELDRIMGGAESKAMNMVTSAEMRAKAVCDKANAESQRIIAEAHGEADALIHDAEDRADLLVSETEIVKKAQEEARIIESDAKVEANELMLKTKHEAYKLLTSVEDDLNEAFKAIRRRRQQLGDDDA